MSEMPNWFKDKRLEDEPNTMQWRPKHTIPLVICVEGFLEGICRRTEIFVGRC